MQKTVDETMFWAGESCCKKYPSSVHGIRITSLVFVNDLGSMITGQQTVTNIANNLLGLIRSDMGSNDIIKKEVVEYVSAESEYSSPSEEAESDYIAENVNVKASNRRKKRVGKWSSDEEMGIGTSDDDLYD